MKSLGITNNGGYNKWIYTYNNKEYWIADLYDFDGSGQNILKPSVYGFTLNDDNEIVDCMDDTKICSNIEEFKKCLSNSIKHIKQLHIDTKLKVINKDFENK